MFTGLCGFASLLCEGNTVLARMAHRGETEKRKSDRYQSGKSTINKNNILPVVSTTIISSNFGDFSCSICKDLERKLRYIIGEKYELLIHGKSRHESYILMRLSSAD